MNRLTLSIFQAVACEQTPEAKLDWLDMAADRAAAVICLCVRSFIFPVTTLVTSYANEHRNLTVNIRLV